MTLPRRRRISHLIIPILYIIINLVFSIGIQFILVYFIFVPILVIFMLSIVYFLYMDDL
jgi:hypothetical protein